MAPLLQLKGITKEYRGNAAVKNIDFDLVEGEIHAILGENGAGKSTLTKIMAGVVEPTSGTMFLAGAPVRFASPAQAMARGVAMVFQETSLVPTMSVAQNLYLGEEKLFNRLRGVNIAAQQFLQSLNFPVDPTRDVASLGAAQRQMVEIARSVRAKARIIIFDEPTASLTPEEKGHFFALVRRLVARGVTIIFISHALEEALDISDRITILRDGERVATDRVSAFDRDKIIRAMVGRTLSQEVYADGRARKARPRGDRVLSVQNLSMGGMVKNTSFSVYAGQVTGLFGLIGSGRTETAKIIAGVLKRKSRNGGEIRLDGRSVRYRAPRQAVRDGVVYVTEDRKIEGFFETMSITENLQVNLAAAGLNSSQIVNMTELRDLSRYWVETLNIRAIDGDSRVIELSGGNQQKLVIARSLLQKPRLIIFDEPTKGVDVGAIAEIHQLVGRLADAGMSIIVISSYLPEVLGISDRVLVYRQGRVVEEFSPKEATTEKIMYAAVH
jgi:simple sugar transport system ATP-binding protein